MTHPPTVSVLLPARDGETWLAEALESLAAQSFSDFEVVAVDDGSLDATPAILREWSGRDPRVRFVSQERLGLVEALERGRSEARGRYLARMDADDMAEPDRLALQLETMKAGRELVGCGTRVRYFPDEAVRDGARRYEEWLNSLITPDDVERNLFVECPLAHPTFFLSASAVEQVGGYRDRGWPEDYDLLLRLWVAGGRFANVPKVLHHWREGEQRLSRTHRRYTPESFRRCKVHYLTRTLLSGKDGVVIVGAGPTGKPFARELAESGVTVRAFVELDPRKIGQEIHGASVIPPDKIGEFRGAYALAAVGQPGAREDVRRLLREAGWEEVRDFIAVA